MKAIITVGVSGSGKSTLAEEYRSKFGYTIIERDSIRKQIFGFSQWKDYKFNKTNENYVTDQVNLMIANSAINKRDIIISDTNLNDFYRNKLVKKLEDLSYDVEIKVMDISWENAVKNNSSRETSVGVDVLYRQWTQFVQYKKDNGLMNHYTPDKSLQEAVICDIDGTIAKMVSRTAFQWDKVDQDEARSFVLELVKVQESVFGRKVVFLSGRDSCCRDLTLKWLKENGFSEPTLFMRPEGNNQKDYFIKEKLFFDNVANKYNVVAVFDDRPQVVNLWNDIGIENVIAVADQRNVF